HLSRQQLFFDASGSSSSEGALTYRWEMGDGVTKEGEGRTHIYGTEGEYTITLTVTDIYGVEASAHVSIVIYNILPIIACYEPENDLVRMEEGKRQRFSVEAEDGNDPVLSYVWMIGQNVVGTDASYRHVAGAPGTYSLTVVVSDGVDSTSHAWSIVVDEPAPPSSPLQSGSPPPRASLVRDSAVPSVFFLALPLLMILFAVFAVRKRKMRVAAKEPGINVLGDDVLVAEILDGDFEF
ncbi:MAG: PKD domain-containing protein, partial [Candidatus Thermoplasmatota archaeon]|nr:PKD domain-containing protein [Candidatus Thermoplasmatota archaeon]